MFTFFKSKNISPRSEKFLEIKSALAGRWDLNTTFSLPGEGPANHLTDALNKVFSRLNTFITDLTKKSVELATVGPLALAISQKVHNSSESLFQGTEQLEETCSQLTEETSKSAESANQALDQSSSIVEEIAYAHSLTDNALQHMRTIENDVGQLSSSIVALDQKSRSIASIIESISNIADQTGLLALNAFIEAARAGDHGAGFGVIANEIRTLSQGTAKAAQDVKDSLLSISELIHETVTAVARVKECAECILKQFLHSCDGNTMLANHLTQTLKPLDVIHVEVAPLSFTQWCNQPPFQKEATDT